MVMSKLIPTIGTEVHCELKTKEKVFSNSLNTYGSMPNTEINEIDLGYPGTLPTLNKEVIDLGIKAALALNCKINKKMHFDRKNYFYPDNPKNYQITQKRTPIGYDGYVEIEIDGNIKKIGIEEMHIEEDTCKSIHEKSITLLDFNRAGIPLIEIVSKPVIESDREAVLYLEKLREILLYADISDVKIEEGSMRCDANVSLHEEDSNVLGTKAEIKNIGSISNVASSILYEIERQKDLIEKGIKIIEETRKYDEKSGTTVLMRVKETGNDYRYFPEPDIPYIIVDDEWINKIKDSLPMLPKELRELYKELGINDIAIKALIQYRSLNTFLKKLIEEKANPVISANILTGDVLAHLNKHNISIEDTKLTIGSVKSLVDKLESNEISSKIGKEILNEMLVSDKSVEEIINSKGLKQINNEEELVSIINNILVNNPKAIDDYKNGLDRSIKFLMGQIMAATKGQANPALANELLIKEIKKLI
jgi:aspartyl-tRNA(Asn)/glutamyl-tRNA(Gln) amidotransferase subunit B